MIEARNLTKSYKPKKGTPVKALDGINLKIEETGMVFILGKSGSGKSTLLNTLGGLDKYDDGEVIIKGKSSRNFTQAEFDSYRNTYVGFIFQEYNILNDFSVGANIALAMELQGKNVTNESLNNLLELVDLVGYASRKPNELSGGQKQRVAIARALIKDPEIIMADEPTGALDSNTGRQIFETLQKLSKTKLVLIVSHDREFAELYGDRVIELADGKIISDIKKYKSKSNTSGGISVIDDKILHVKKGYTLTEEDLKLINQYIINNKNDTIISLDANSNLDFRKAAKIDDEGNKDSFKDTKEEDLNVKNYNESNFKLIKSRLSIKNASRIGASSLKVKPFRLAITILLATVAFALFGLADTIGTYDKVTTATQSIIDSKIEYVSFRKQTLYEYEDYDGDIFSYYNYSNSGVSDLTFLKEKFPHCNLIGVYSGNEYNSTLGSINNYKDITKIANSYGNSYYTSLLTGITEVNIDDLNRLDYELLENSTFPITENQVLITKYTYEHYELAGWKDLENSEITADINSVSDIINKTIYINNKKFSISGVLDTKLNETRYEKLKEPTDTDEGIGRYLLASEFNTNLEYGPHALIFTKNGFLEANEMTIEDSYANYGGGYSIYADYDFVDIDGNMSQNVYFPFQKMCIVENLNDTDLVLFNGKTKATISDNDVIIPLFQAIDMYAKKNGEDAYGMLISGLHNEVYTYANNYYISNGETAFLNTFDDFIKFRYSDQETPTISGIINSYSDYYSKLYETKMYGMSLDKTVLDYVQPLSYFENIVNSKYIDILKNYSELPELRIYVENFGRNDSSTYYYNIVGIDTRDINNNVKEGKAYFSNDGLERLNVKLVKNSPFIFLLGNMPTEKEKIKEIVEFNYKDSGDAIYQVANSVTYILSMVNNLIEILATVFIYVGIGFAIFAALLLMNYISTSISYKKREIGILRAVGARSNDVFLIFFSESFIIACINWLLAVCVTIFTVVAINYYLRSEYGLQITILNLGIRQILLILLISIAVSFISSFLPVRKIARKKPIDAIQNR